MLLPKNDLSKTTTIFNFQAFWVCAQHSLPNNATFTSLYSLWLSAIASATFRNSLHTQECWGILHNYVSCVRVAKLINCLLYPDDELFNQMLTRTWKKAGFVFVKIVFHFVEFEMFPYSLQLQRKHIGTDVEVERSVASFFYSTSL